MTGFVISGRGRGRSTTFIFVKVVAVNGAVWRLLFTPYRVAHYDVIFELNGRRTFAP